MRRNHGLQVSPVLLLLLVLRLQGSPTLLQEHCHQCHNEEKAKGKFEIRLLGDAPNQANIARWRDALDLVTAAEMPPEDESQLTPADRAKLATYFKAKLQTYQPPASANPLPRRLNNREFERSVRDALLIEDVGTHQPTANLIGDARHHGFDTHAETLGFSRFHLEQYIDAVRKIVETTLLPGPQPETKHYDIQPQQIVRGSLSQNTRRRIQRGTNGYFDFLDPRLHAYFEPFEIAPETGWYEIRIRATAKDRFVYKTEETGVYHDDPIQLAVHLGDRIRTFDLPDEEPTEIKLTEWIAAGTRLKLYYPTDGLRFQGNGNFKFQYRIAHNHLKANDKARYQHVLKTIVPKAPQRTRKSAAHWSHWTREWEGPRPRLLDATIRGPFYHSWPSQRQVALIGDTPSADQAEERLHPIAERAWRRQVSLEELEPIGNLVRKEARSSSIVESFGEGIIAILSSPEFLLLNSEKNSNEDRFTSKLSYFLNSTLPDERLRQVVHSGKLNTFKSVKDEVKNRLAAGDGNALLREFPFAWLELNDINFMAPDPDHYPFYHRKRVSEDMVEEVLTFFRHAIANNSPLSEFLTANYSFINADLATIYGVSDIPADSQFRRYTFADGTRGGLLGMGAFLTATADSLSTSPIHRAVYVMENFLGIHPKPPPADVQITEPDVRQAKTIKAILQAHRSDPTCASCHQGIDPYGYAFENFDPTGAWRDRYTAPSTANNATQVPKRRKRRATPQGIPVDASAQFRNGARYQNIKDFRELLAGQANQERFVRCFINKLLTYANGAEPDAADFGAIEDIRRQSEASDYRIVDTIAAVIHSPLFRNR